MGSVTRLKRSQVKRHVTFTYIDVDGNYQECDVSQAGDVEFEKAQPVRTFTYSPTQKHTPGKLWSTTCGRHLDYESYLESRWLLVYDRDPAIVGISTQPFRIECLDPLGSWRHTPDVFLRHADGTGTVVDVKPEQFVDEDVLEQSERTREVCAEVGWTYLHVSEPDPQYMANIEWLSAYRRCAPDIDLRDRILHLAQRPVTVGELVAATDQPDSTSSIGHMLWTGELDTDLQKRITIGTYVRNGRTQ